MSCNYKWMTNTYIYNPIIHAGKWILMTCNGWIVYYLEKSIHSAVKADLNRALKNRKHENLKMMIESHLGSTCLVMLGLLNTEKTDKSHMEEVLKQLVDMALTETDNNCVNHKVIVLETVFHLHRR